MQTEQRLVPERGRPTRDSLIQENLGVPFPPRQIGSSMRLEDEAGRNADTVMSGSPVPPHDQSPRMSRGPPSTESQEIASLRSQLEAARRETEDVRRQLRQATNALNRVQEDRVYKVDDNYVAGEFQSLRYEIRSWAGTHFGGELTNIMKTTLFAGPSQEFNDAVGIEFVSVFMKKPVLRIELVQSVVWSELISEVFWRGLTWAGKCNAAVADVFALLSKQEDRIPPEEFHRWRTQTVPMVIKQMTVEEIDANINSAMKRSKSILKPFATDKSKMVAGLSEIFRKASALDREMMGQRAAFSIQMPRKRPHGVPLDRNSMDWPEDLATDATCRTAVTLAPMLLKRGTANGEHYEQLSILVKAQIRPEVLASKPNKLIKSPPGTPLGSRPPTVVYPHGPPGLPEK